VAGYDSRFAIT